VDTNTVHTTVESVGAIEKDLTIDTVLVVYTMPTIDAVLVIILF
jgi:hypothetical protein